MQDFTYRTVQFSGSISTLPAVDARAQGYVRVGLGGALAAETQFTDVDCESTMPAALYGCGTGGDGTPLRTSGEFGITAGLELGAGYAVGPAVRIELQVHYRSNVPFQGRANFLVPGREQWVTAQRSSVTGLVAAEFDVPTRAGRGIAGFRPFAGVSIGRVHHRLGETRMTFPATRTIVPGASRTQ